MTVPQDVVDEAIVFLLDAIVCTSSQTWNLNAELETYMHTEGEI